MHCRVQEVTSGHLTTHFHISEAEKNWVLGCIHYVLPGGWAKEDFINQYSIFSYPPAQFSKNFVSPERMDQILLSPPPPPPTLLEFESFDTGTICNDCGSLLLSRGEDLSPKLVQCTALGNSEDFEFENTKKRPKKPLLLFICCCVIGRNSKENLPKFTRWLRKTDKNVT